MTEERKSKPAKRKFLLAVLALAVLLAVGGLFRFLTFFDQALIGYARLGDGNQAEWYRQATEVVGEELTVSLYEAIYSPNNRIPAKAEHGFTFNTIEGGVVPALRCQGMLYIVLHKWKNHCAGVCVPVADGVTRVAGRELDYFPIPDSEWQHWKIDFDR